MKSLIDVILRDAVYRFSFWFAVILLVMAAMPLFEFEIVFLELVTHFSGLFALTAAMLFLYVLLRRRKYAAREVSVLCILAMLANAAWLIPFFPIKQNDPRDDDKVLKVVQLNVLKVNRHTNEVIGWLRNERAHIIAVHEVDQGWLSALASLRDIYPHRISKPSNSLFGVAIFSQFPLGEKKIETMPIYDAPAIFASADWNGTKVRIAAIHAPPPLVTKSVAARKSTLGRVISWAQEDSKTPAIVLGDLNMTPTTALYRRVIDSSGLSDPRKGRGMLPTWPVPMPSVFRLPLDYVLHSDRLSVLSFRIGPSVRSDHHPVIATFELTK